MESIATTMNRSIYLLLIYLFIITYSTNYATTAQEVTTATTMASIFDVTRPMTTPPTVVTDEETTVVGGLEEATTAGSLTCSSSPCGTNAVCANTTTGGFNCTCNIGFSGDGLTCSDIDECAAGDKCHLTLATCTNNDGSYTCTCNAGYTGTGIVCTDFDECSAGADNCHANADCTNTEASFNCSCKDGFYGNGIICYQIPTLESPTVLSIGRDTINVIVENAFRYEEYEVRVVNVDTPTRFVRTRATTTIQLLNPFTTYEIATRVVRANGFNVTNANFSVAVNFTTEIVTIPVALRVEVDYVPAFNDSTSTEYRDFVTLYLERMVDLVNSAGLGFSVPRYRVLGLRAGSTVVSSILETNSTNITDADRELSMVISPEPLFLSVKTLTANLTAPVVTLVDVTGALTATVNYTPISNATSYEIEVSCPSGTSTFTSTTNSVTVTVANPNSICTTRVKATVQVSATELGETPFSEAATFTTLSTINNLEVSAIADTINVKWDNLPRAQFYIVTTVPTSSVLNVSASTVDADGKVSTQVTGLTLDTAYSVSVVAHVLTAEDILRAGLSASAMATTPGSLVVNNIFIIDVKSTGFNVTFSSVKGATSYVVRYSFGGSLTSVDTTNTDVQVTSANPLLNDYTVQVAYKVGDLTSEYTTLSTRVWNVSAVTQTSFSLTWRPFTPAILYVVVEGTTSRNFDAATTSGAISDLVAGSDNTITINGVRSDGSYTPLVTFNQLTVPASPSNIAATSGDNSTVVSWDSSLGAVDYNVSITAVDGSSTSSVVGTSVTTSTSASLSNLRVGFAYTIQVCSQNSQGSSCASINFTTNFPAPAAPRVSGITQTTFTVSFDSLPDVQSYWVEVLSGGVLVQNSTITGVTTGFTGLQSGTNYNTRVTARYVSGSSVPSSETTTTTVPAEPTGLTVVRLETSYSELQWTESRGAEEYLLAVTYANSTNVFANYILRADNATTITFPTNSAPNVTLDAGVDYVFRVFSRNSGGDSGTVTIPFQTRPNPPINVTVDNISQESAQVNFVRSQGAESFVIVANPGNLQTLTTDSNTTINGLSAGTIYNITVSSYGKEQIGFGNLTSSPSEIVTIITVPRDVQDFQVDSRTNDSLTFSFTPSPNADSYIITLTSGASISTTAAVTSSPAQVSGLSSATSYNVTIVASNRNGNSGLVLIEAYTRGNNPAVLNVVSSQTNLLVTWAAPASVAAIRNYTLNLTDTKTGAVTTITQTNSTYSFDGLTPARYYDIELTTIDSSGPIPNPTQVRGLTLPTTLKNLAVVDQTNESISYNWTAVETVTAYVYTCVDMRDGSQVATGSTVNSSLTIDGLSNGVEYQLVVRAQNPSGLGNRTINLAWTVQSPFLAYANFVSNTNQSIIYNIANTPGGVTTYKLTLQGTGTPVVTGTCSIGTPCTITGLLGGTDYAVTVQGQYVSGVYSEAGPARTYTTVPLFPVNLRALAQDFSFDVSMDAVRGATSYAYEVEKDGVTTNFTSPTPTFKVESLDSGAVYIIRVAAVKSTSYGIFTSTYVEVTNNTVQATPTGLAVTDITSESIGLTWDNIPGVITYQVFAVPSFDPSKNSRSVDVSSTSIIVEGLSPSTNYTFHMRGVYMTGLGPNSTDVTSTTGPEKPVGLKTEAATRDSITIAWDPIVYVTQYLVAISRNGVAVGREFSSVANFTATSLQAGTVYTFEILPFSGPIRGSLLSDKYKQTTVPDKVQIDEDATMVTQTSVSIMYNRPAGTETYKVTLKSNATTVSEKDLSTGFVVFEFADGVRPGQTYAACVRGLTGNGTEYGVQQISEESCTTAITKPANSTTPMRVSSTANSITVTYTNATGAVYYRLHAQAKLNSSDIQIARSNFTNGTISGLQPGTEYLITVTAIGVSGTSFLSGELSTFTNPSPPVLSISSVTSTTFTLNWSVQPVVQLVIYTIENSAGEPVIVVTNATADAERANITNLRPGTTYTVQAFALAEALFSLPATATTVTVPNPPIELILNSQNNDSLTFSWNNVTGAADYVVSYRLFNTTTTSLTQTTTTSNFTTLTGLEPASYYDVFVSAQNTAGRSAETNATFVTTASYGPAVRVRSVYQTNVTVEFDSVRGAWSYNVSYASDSSQQYKEVDAGLLSPSFYVTNLSDMQPGTVYNISVQVVYPFGRSKFGPITSQITVPSAPLNITSFVSDNTVDILWNEVKGASNYTVALTAYDTFVGAVQTNKDKRSARFSNLQYGYHYDVVVCVSNEAGNTCATSSFETGRPHPTGFSVTNVTQTSFLVYFDQVQGAINYTAEMEVDSRGVYTNASTTTNVFNVTGLVAGVNFTVYVTAFYNTGRSVRYEALHQITSPPNPTGLELQRADIESADFRWSRSLSATSYGLTLYNSSGDRIGWFDLPADTASTISFTTTRFNVSLDAGAFYNLTLNASNEAGTSGDISLRFQTRTSPPTNVTVDNVSQTSAQVSFVPPQGAESFVVIANPGNLQQPTTATVVTIGGMEAGTIYNITVVALGIDQPPIGILISAPSDAVEITSAPRDVQNFTGISRTSSQISFEFVPSPNAVKYDFTVTFGSSLVHNFEVFGTPFTAGGLSSGTEYTFSIVAVNDFGRSSAVSINNFTRPVNPSEFTLLNVSENTLSIGWNVPKAASILYGYDLELWDPATGERVPGTPVFSRTPEADFDKLTSGTNYQLRVNVQDVDGKVPSPGIYNTITLPARVRNLTLVDQTDSSLSLEWNRVFGANGYVITVSQPLTLSPEVTTSTVSTNITVGGLLNGTGYVVVVTARTASGVGKPATILDYTIQEPFLSSVNFDSNTVSSFNVTVVDGAPGVVTYIVEAIPEEGRGDNRECETSTQQCVIEGLQSGTNYDVRVKGRYSSGATSNFGGNSTFTTVPDRPRSLAASSSDFAVNVTYDAVFGVTYYNLTLRDAVGNVIDQSQINSTYYRFSNLLSGKEYQVEVIAVKVFERILVVEFVSASSYVTFETTKARPVNVQVTSITSTAIGVQWNDIRGILFYQALAVPEDNSYPNVTCEVVAVNNSCTLTDSLVSSEYYNIYVRGNYETGFGPYSDEEVRQVSGPSQPSNVVVTAVSKNQISLSWQPVQYATNYSVLLSGGNFSTTTWVPTAAYETEPNLLAGTPYVFTITPYIGDIEGTIPSDPREQITTPESVTFSLVVVSQTTITLTTDRPVGVQNFGITIHQGLELVYARNSGSQLNFFDFDDGIRPGTAYNLCVIGETGTTTGIQQFSAPGCIIATTLPDNSTTPERVVSTTTTITYNHSASAGAQYYIVEVVRSDDPTDVRFVNSTEVVATAEGLEPGIAYLLSVTAYGVSGSSFTSEQVEIRTKPTAPAVFVSNVQSNSFTLSWVALAIIDSNYYTVSENGTGLIAQSAFVPTVHGNSVTIVGLLPGTVYNAEVISTVVGITSAPGVLSQITVPSAPSDINVDLQTTDSIKISWPVVKGASQYYVRYGLVGSASTSTRVVAGDNVLIGSLDSGSQYQFIVWASNAAGNSTVTATSLWTVVSEGPSVTVHSITTTSLSVTIQTISGAVSYAINVNGETIPQSTTEAVVNDLSPGVRYTISGQAIYSAGSSTFGAPVPRYTITSPVGLVLASNSRDSGITIDVTVPTGALPITIRGLENGNLDFTRENIVSSTTIIFTNTRLATTYTFSTQASNPDGLLSAPTSLTVATGAVKTFNLEVTLNRPYNANLRNTSSVEYANMRNYVVAQLTRAYDNSNGFAAIAVQDFWQDGENTAVWHQVSSDRVSSSAEMLIEEFENTPDTDFERDAFVNIPTTNFNECLPRPCPSDATCTDLVVGYQCTCGSGYEYAAPVCVDVDECALNLDNCHENADCINSEGGFVCRCRSGYQGSGVTCSNVDECSDSRLNTCDVNAQCTDEIGSYKCDCLAGFLGDGRSCVNIDECAAGGANDCDENASCSDTTPGFTCTCNTGFSGDGKTCTDVDECAANLDNCNVNANCANNVGSFSCACRAGYSGNGIVCNDINECAAANRCGDKAVCLNNDGSYSCRCESGYQGDPTAGCTDINECASDVCSTNAVCANEEGSHTCTCNAGFVGDGEQCFATQQVYFTLDASSECAAAVEALTLSELEALVIEQLGLKFGGLVDVVSVVGFVEETKYVVVNLQSSMDWVVDPVSRYNASLGSASFCYGSPLIVPADPCVNATATCGPNASCTTSTLINKFTCTCDVGYDSTGEDGNCEFIKPCDTERCHTNAICTNILPSDFTCACEEGLFGDGLSCFSSVPIRLTLNETFVFTDDLNDPTSEAYANLQALVLAALNDKFPGLDVSFAVTGFEEGSVIAVIEVLSDPSTPLSADEVASGFDDSLGDELIFPEFIVVGHPCLSEPCVDGATCTEDGDVNYNCTCPSGYSGDGKASCDDVNECTGDLHDCSAVGGACENTEGSFICSCSSGFTGDGRVCADVDECQVVTTCGARETCTNLIGSHSCTCSPGNKNVTNTCLPQCNPNPCQNDGECVPTSEVGEPACVCTIEYTGPTCEQRSYLRTVLIVVGTLGGLFLIFLIIVLVLLIRRRKQRKLNLP